MRNLSLAASAGLAAVAAAGVLSPAAPRPVHGALFEICFALALVAIASHWLPPSDPDAVPS